MNFSLVPTHRDFARTRRTSKGRGEEGTNFLLLLCPMIWEGCIGRRRDFYSWARLQTPKRSRRNAKVFDSAAENVENSSSTRRTCYQSSSTRGSRLPGWLPKTKTSSSSMRSVQSYVTHTDVHIRRTRLRIRHPLKTSNHRRRIRPHRFSTMH